MARPPRPARAAATYSSRAAARSAAIWARCSWRAVSSLRTIMAVLWNGRDAAPVTRAMRATGDRGEDLERDREADRAHDLAGLVVVHGLEGIAEAIDEHAAMHVAMRQGLADVHAGAEVAKRR